MNILWLPSMLPFPSDNGCKIVISNRMKQLKKRGNKLFMIVESNKIDINLKLYLDDFFEKYILVKPIKRDKIYKIYWFVFASLNLGRYWNPEIIKQIDLILREQQIDGVIIEMPMLAINYIPISMNYEIPVIISQHNIESEAIRSKNKVKGISFFKKIYSHIESKRLYNWEKKLYKNSLIKGQIFVTFDDLIKYKEIFPNSVSCKMLCSPIGTDLPQEQIAPFNIEGKIIVFPAAFDYSPNIHGASWFVNNVLPIILNEIPSVKIMLVGRNPNHKIKKLADKNVIVTGGVDSMLPYFFRADIFVVPLFFGGGMKTKLIEMGCFSKPVVTTSSGLKGTKYINGIDLYEENTINDFATRCIDILKNPKKYLKSSLNMKEKTINTYLWDNIGKEYSNFIGTIVNKELLRNEDRNN